MDDLLLKDAMEDLLLKDAMEDLLLKDAMDDFLLKDAMEDLLLKDAMEDLLLKDAMEDLLLKDAMEDLLLKVRSSPHDDGNSVTSGETTTSDSGRGGSEDDIPLPPIAECSPELNSELFPLYFRLINTMGLMRVGF
ncbi:protocadherin gamma-A10 [Biomphalaria glabrata]|nr:protocadherin gamma-A10 [Biomphalaria glabrata]